MALRSPQIRLKTLVPMFRQLATTHQAGIDLIRGFDVLKREQKDPNARELLTHLQDDIRNGATLTEATRRQAHRLPPYVVESIAAGEMGGKLDIMFNDLADYFEDRLAMRRRILTRLAYLIGLVIAAWFLGTFSVILIRRVVGVFSGGTFSFGAFFLAYALFQAKALIVAAIVVIAGLLLRRVGLLSWIWGGFSTHIWPLAPVTKRFALARFFRSMALLIHSGLPMHHCIQRAAAVTANPYIRRDLEKAIPPVKDGESLTAAFSNCRYLLPTAREMLYVGEESGSLDLTLRKVSDYYLDEASHAVERAIPVVYFLIYFMVAGAVGYTLYLFYSSYFGAFDALGI